MQLPRGVSGGLLERADLAQKLKALEQTSVGVQADMVQINILLMVPAVARKSKPRRGGRRGLKRPDRISGELGGRDPVGSHISRGRINRSKKNFSPYLPGDIPHLG